MNNSARHKINDTKRKALFFALFFLIFGVSFAHRISAQTTDQINYYAERIEFGTEDVKRNALFDLRNFRTAAASRIAVPALRDSEEIVRATAAASVVFLPKDEAVRVLLPLLNEKSEFIRREAAYALGKVESSSATRSLIGILKKDKKPEVRNASAVALGQIGDVAAITDLLNVLNRKPTDKERFLRRSAARSLGQIAQNLQRLDEEPLVTPESFLPENYKKIHKPKYPNLAGIFPIFQAVNSRLIIVLQSEKETADTRREAAFALGEIGDISSIQILVNNLTAEDLYLAEISKEALRKVCSVEERTSCPQGF